MRLFNLVSIIISLTFFISCKAEFENGVSDIDSWDMSEGYEPLMVHPGVLHTNEDFTFIKEKISLKEEPYYSTYLALAAEPKASSSYTIKGPFSIIARDGDYGSTKVSAESDFDAIYLNSIMWWITGEEAHAQKSLDLMLQYASVLEDIDGNDTALMSGLEGIKIVYALEVLRYTYTNMTDEQFELVNAMLKRVFLPVWEEFYNVDPYTNGNWGLHVLKSYMAASILWNDIELYKKCVNLFLYGNDNGTVSHYLDAETGQCQESGRDQGHVILGLGAMSTVCEIAWKQGNDLYSSFDNRILTGYEYTVKYNLGYDVPFKQWTDVTGKYCNWTEISQETKKSNNGIDVDRGQKWQPCFYMVYNHYVNRKGLSMPYTKELFEVANYKENVYDGGHPSFGPLLFNN